MPFTPVACYGLEVPPGGMLIPAQQEFPASFHITMAALDPTEEPEPDDGGEVPPIPRSTLKIVRSRLGVDDDGEIDDDYMKQLLAASSDDEEDSEDDDEPNGGPSDPSKSQKQKRANAIARLLEAADEDDEDNSDEDMEDAKGNGKPNGIKASAKGKEKATDEDEEDDEDEDESDDDDLDLETFVVCTLDTQGRYQQPLDIVVGEGEHVFFRVEGTHTIHLTGNYIIDDDEEVEDDSDEDEDEYDEEDLEDMIEDGDSDELDDLENPRITEVDSQDEEDEEEEEAPKLVSAQTKKGKKKRPAEDEAEGLDEMIAKGEEKAGKQKKLKNNKGEAVAAEVAKPAKGDKKVQFAKDLEQGPTSSTEKPKQAGKPSLGVKVVQGVTVDDRKVGSGRTVKNGDTVGVRYIGKLDNGKVFDSNKKGKPFSFKVGKGQVIKGWDIGILGMTISGERRLTIPANLAYGSKSMPGIPASSTLTFDVKLLEIK